jgi:hypothetical protein
MEAEPDDGGVRVLAFALAFGFGGFSSGYPKTAPKFVSLDATPQAGTPTA